MSVSEKKEKKVLTPSIEDSPTDMYSPSNTSGNACICVIKRNIACVLHGG